MHRSKIEWCQNPDGSLGWVWNPITGCLGPKGDGVRCPYCYARRLAEGRLKQRYLANTHTPQYKTLLYTNPFYPRFWEERLYDLPISPYAQPRGIFVCDMSDLFGIGIPEEWTKKVFARMWWGEQHRYYLLTKQPQNLAKFSPFPDNCWVGVTATNQQQFDDAIHSLCDAKAKVRYISFEPLLSGIGDLCANRYCGNYLKEFIDWLIIGGQTKPSLPPKIEWVSEIVEAADRAGIPVFLKDNLRPLLGDNLRQELPARKGEKDD